eukprot:6896742-Prymnesium_polylepis.2
MSSVPLETWFDHPHKRHRLGVIDGKAHAHDHDGLLLRCALPLIQLARQARQVEMLTQRS